MKARLLENRWTVEITDFDITTASNSEVQQIGNYLLTNLVVVLKDQHGLLPGEEIEFCERFGKVQKLPEDEKERHLDHMPEQTNGIFMVTGGGLFGHKETLDWHANQPSSAERSPLIWLYGVEHTKGSKTSWINNKLAYDDLPRETKERLKKINVYCGFSTGNYTPSTFFKEHINRDNPIPLVYTNDGGMTGLFFPFYQILEFEGDNSDFNNVMKYITNHVTQEKYQYHHEWQDGDVVISEQWLSIHKRWRFEEMDKRLLHRIAFDYDRIKVSG